jgi:hypothetical protein
MYWQYVKRNQAAPTSIPTNPAQNRGYVSGHAQWSSGHTIVGESSGPDEGWLGGRLCDGGRKKAEVQGACLGSQGVGGFGTKAMPEAKLWRSQFRVCTKCMHTQTHLAEICCACVPLATCSRMCIILRHVVLSKITPIIVVHTVGLLEERSVGRADNVIGTSVGTKYDVRVRGHCDSGSGHSCEARCVYRCSFDFFL